ncbi:MAG: signal peptide peptidase SppA [Bacteroidales bacterium]|nr:signal peptide peptidase SppA [Bacteroidales bacterium]
MGDAFGEPVLGLNEILECIDKAKTDDKVDGIYLELDNIQANMATLDEIRNAIIAFKESEKFVIAYGTSYEQRAYYLATVADKIYMNPEGVALITGLRAQLLFISETMNKLGVEPQIIRHGKFKSAIEPLVNVKMSDENRQQIQAYMGLMWEYMVKNISASRGISPEQFNYLADSLLMWDPKNAIDNKLMDSLIYKDELIEILKNRTNVDDEPNVVPISDYIKVPRERKGKGLIKQKIAVIYATGTIQQGEEYEENIGANKISRTIREARKDSSIKAIVFRVNSGGGSALASEIIWREIDLTRKVKPVIASLGDVAASGGYYIVAPSDHIVDNPLTLTGSIGVFPYSSMQKNSSTTNWV